MAIKRDLASLDPSLLPQKETVAVSLILENEIRKEEEMWAYCFMLKGMAESGVIHNTGEVSTIVGLLVWIGMPIAFYLILRTIGFAWTKLDKA